MQIDVIAAGFYPVDFVNSDQELTPEFLNQEAVGNSGDGNFILCLGQETSLALQAPDYETVKVNQREDEEVGAEVFQILIAEFARPVAPVIAAAIGGYSEGHDPRPVHHGYMS